MSHNSRRGRSTRENSLDVDSALTGGDTSLLTQRLQGHKYSPSPSRRTFEMTTTTSGKLAQEIHDEFLVCKICLEGYKSPKSLNCLHTFCEQCIESHVLSESTYKKYSDYREFTCPLCRKRTQLPIGGVKKLPDNFLVSSLSEVVTRQKPSIYPFCDICKLVTRKHKEAKAKCLDCAKLLCDSCVTLHRETKVTANHSLFDVEIEKDVECKEHNDEVVRFYCEPCETCICVLCTFNEHKDHEITQFGEAVTKYKTAITTLLEVCKAKIKKFDGQIDSLNRCEDIIKNVEQKIHETAIQYIADVRNREKQLIEEVKNIYGKHLIDMVENKKDLSVTVESLRSTCNLTEVILKGKDIELLLLKKDVQEKLSTLNSFEVQLMPGTVNKQVNFVIGSLDMGYVQDMDRPVLTKMKVRKMGAQEVEMKVSFSDKQTQTDTTKTPEKTRKSESSDDDDDEEDDESESESESEDEVKPDLVERGIQTDKVTILVEDPARKFSRREQGTLTELIPLEEKGVNTLFRSLPTSTSGPGSRTETPPKDTPEDNSLAARRRRRRERAQTQQIAPPTFTFDMGDQSTFMERRKRNMNAYNRSLDAGDDVFYDKNSTRVY